MGTAELIPGEWELKEGLLRREATLKLPGVDDQVFWFEVPEEQKTLLSDRSDPFVLGTIFSVMQHGTRLRIHGPVSSSLLANLEEFQRVWAAWAPERYRVTDLVSDEEIDDSPPVAESAAIASFSGGLDSAFTAFLHTFSRSRTRPLKHLLIVHGFDIPLESAEAFYEAVASAKAIAAHLALDLVTCSTNLRALKQRWIEAHGALVAAALHIHATGHSAGLIASTHRYDRLRTGLGSSPLTDPLLSSKSFRIIHHGAGFSRPQKIEALLGHPQILNNLRVCWEGPDEGRNCSHCEKCLRTMLEFRSVGAPIPDCFDADALSKWNLMRLRAITPGQRRFFNAILRAARERGIEESWVKDVQRMLVYQRAVRVPVFRAKRAARRIASEARRRWKR